MIIRVPAAQKPGLLKLSCGDGLETVQCRGCGLWHATTREVPFVSDGHTREEAEIAFGIMLDAWKQGSLAFDEEGIHAV